MEVETKRTHGFLRLRAFNGEGEMCVATLRNTLVLLSLPRSNSPCYLAVKTAGGGDVGMQARREVGEANGERTGREGQWVGRVEGKGYCQDCGEMDG